MKSQLNQLFLIYGKWVTVTFNILYTQYTEQA